MRILPLKTRFSNQIPSLERNNMDRYFKFYEERIAAGIIISLILFVIFFIIGMLK